MKAKIRMGVVPVFGELKIKVSVAIDPRGSHVPDALYFRGKDAGTEANMVHGNGRGVTNDIDGYFEEEDKAIVFVNAILVRVYAAYKKNLHDLCDWKDVEIELGVSENNKGFQALFVDDSGEFHKSS